MMEKQPQAAALECILPDPSAFCVPPTSSQSSYLLQEILLNLLQHDGKSVLTAKAKEESKPSGKEAAPVKPKPAGKTPAKPLPELIQEDVIPSLQTILEAQNDLSEIELSFNDNRLQGPFQKNGIPYSFWAFFPDGVLTGPKGFSLSSYGAEVSTVEPFLIDEKKITSKHVVFWVEKRLAAQGILPVWKE